MSSSRLRDPLTEAPASVNPVVGGRRADASRGEWETAVCGFGRDRVPDCRFPHLSAESTRDQSPPEESIPSISIGWSRAHSLKGSSLAHLHPDVGFSTGP